MVIFVPSHRRNPVFNGISFDGGWRLLLSQTLIFERKLPFFKHRSCFAWCSSTLIGWKKSSWNPSFISPLPLVFWIGITTSSDWAGRSPRSSRSRPPCKVSPIPSLESNIRTGCTRSSSKRMTSSNKNASTKCSTSSPRMRCSKSGFVWERFELYQLLS